MRVAIKPGVKLLGLRPETLLAITYATIVCHGQQADFTLTSVCDGRHSVGSLHYAGAAFDFRIRDMAPDQVAAVFKNLKDGLGSEYDTVLEKTHIHVEFQPKRA